MSDMLEKMARAIRECVYEHDAVDDDVHQDAAEIAVRQALSVLRNASTGKPVTDHVIRAYVDEILGEK